jgi:deoxyribodipyrimidine photolyase
MSVTFEQIQEAFAENAKRYAELYDRLHETSLERNQLYRENAALTDVVNWHKEQFAMMRQQRDELAAALNHMGRILSRVCGDSTDCDPELADAMNCENDAAAILREHDERRDAEVKREASRATMEWVLRVVENMILYPEDLEREDDDAMQAWKDLKAVLQRALPTRYAALVKPLVEALTDVESKIVDYVAGKINWRPDDFLYRVRAALAPYRERAEVAPTKPEYGLLPEDVECGDK